MTADDILPSQADSIMPSQWDDVMPSQRAPSGLQIPDATAFLDPRTRSQVLQQQRGDPNEAGTDFTYALSHQLPADIGSGAAKLGTALRHVSDAAELLEQGNPEKALNEFTGTPNAKGQTPYEEDVAAMPKPLQMFEAGKRGLIESAPKMAAVAGGEAVGIPAPVSGAAVFGMTPEGFSPRDAAIAAALPFAGRLGGAVTENLAKRLDVPPSVAEGYLSKLGGAAGVTGLLTADQVQRISQLPPDQREAATVDAIGNAASMMLLGMMGGHEAGESGQENISDHFVDANKMVTPEEEEMPSRAQPSTAHFDPVQSAIERLRQPEDAQVPASKADVADLSKQVDDLKAALQNPFKPSEPTPDTEPAPVEPSQPDAGTTVSPASAASPEPVKENGELHDLVKSDQFNQDEQKPENLNQSAEPSASAASVRASLVPKVEQEIAQLKAKRENGISVSEFESGDDGEPPQWIVSHKDVDPWFVYEHNGVWMADRDGSVRRPSDNTREAAIEEARDAIRDELGEQKSTFGADLDNSYSIGEMFDKFDVPHGWKSEGWFRTKWGSWYNTVTDEDGNSYKISVRDHEASRKDMGLPDKSAEVSKNWEPEEVHKALSRLESWMRKKSGNSIDLESRPSEESFTRSEKASPSEVINGGKKTSLSDQANAMADKLEGLKTGIGEGGQLHLFGIAADLWDRALTVAQKALRAGGSVADAIDEAIQHIRDHFKGRFDEAGARAELVKQLGGVEQETSSPERERSADQVKAELAQADQQLKEAIGAAADAKKRPEGMSKADAVQAQNRATAAYRGLREELLSHPDYVAEQIAKNHAAVTEANELLRPHGRTFNPEEYLDPSSIPLTGEQRARLNQLQRDAEASHLELTKMPKKMVSRVYAEMQKDGRLPKPVSTLEQGAGRTLDRMTDYLKANKIDSPAVSWADRLSLTKKAAEMADAVRGSVNKAWARAQTWWKTGVETFKNPPKENDFRNVIKHWIGYDQRTAVENYRYAKALTERVQSPLRRKAMSAWLDAGGDRSVLESQRQQIPAKYREIWDTALKLTPDEQKIASQVRDNFAQKLEDAINTGLVKQGREDYGVPQRWKTPPSIERAADPFGEGKKGSPGNPYAKLDPRDPFFSFQRETPSYFDGIMAGGEPENLDIAHLVTNYDEAFHKALSSRGAVAALQDAVAADGAPVVKISGRASMANQKDGGKAYFVDSKARAPGDVSADGRPYLSLDHFALKDWKVAFKDENGNPIMVKGDMLIHPDHFDFLKNELETPRWTAQGLGKRLLQANTWLKNQKFIGPFHMVTEALHATFHGVNPSVSGFEVDLSDPKQALLNRNMMMGFGRARELFEDGLNSNKSIFAHVPGLGDAIVKMNNFTFSEYIPRLKMKVGLAVLDRNMERYAGKLSEDQIAELTGKQMDAAFGGQNWRLLGANKNTLAVMRLGLVAPDFLLSRSKVIGQAFTRYGAEQRMFLLAQTAGVYMLARVINTMFSDNHDPHFEASHWDSVVIGNRSYHARFLVSDAANLARDLLGLGSFKQKGIPFISGRIGVVPKTLAEATMGRDIFTGANKDGIFEAHNPVLKAFSIVAKDVAEWMTPMAVDGFIGGAAKGQTGPGQMIAATVGISSKKESATSKIYDLAGQFNRNSKDAAARSFQQERDNSSGPPSDYRILDNLLDAGKLDAAQKAYDALRAGGHAAKSIAAHFDRNLYYSGNAQRERSFVASLTPEQRSIYQQAAAERAARRQVFDRLRK